MKTAHWTPTPILHSSLLSTNLIAPVFKSNPLSRSGPVPSPPATNMKSRTATRASSRASTRAATIKQAFSMPAGSDPCFPGNSSLRPERSQTYDAGLDQFLAGQRLRLSATYFNNRFRDIVSFTFDPATTAACQQGTGTYFNTDLARARGVNLSGELRLRRWLSLDGNYSYDDSRVLESPNAFDSVQMPGNHLLRRPVNSGSLILNTSYRHWNLNLTGYFSGIRTDSDFLGLGLTHNPGYARFDLATSYLIGRSISFTGRVTNLFDKQYQDALGFPALGRDFRVGLNYRFTGRN